MRDFDQLIVTYLERQWIEPPSESLDEEDRARIQLILELQETFGVNEESVPIILHLIDQLHCLRNLIKNRS